MNTHTATFWTPTGLAEACGGRWVGDAPPAEQAIHGLHTDTRTLVPGQAFLALRGERFDGHDYLHAAVAAGAALLIVDQVPDDAPGLPMLVVPDTLAALQQLARVYRDRLREAGVSVIAVAGSNGKTTTRELIHAALSSTKTGTRSPRSFNNHIGVPLTLLGAALDHDYVVCEVGTNHPGEIAFLAELLRPDAACITSIGMEHLEGFGSLDGVIHEEAQIIPHIQPDGLLSLPETHGDALLQQHAPPAGVAVSRLDHEPSLEPRDARLDARSLQHCFTIGGTGFCLPLIGRHNLANARHAIAITRWVGVPDADTARGMANAQPAPMRMAIQRLPNGITLINDAYNANPDSMAAALDTLADLPAPDHARRVAVLGDMLEQGHTGPGLHRGIGAQLADTHAIDHAVTVGPLAMFIAEALDKQRPGTAHPFPDRAAAAAALPGLIEPNDVVLLKASRGLQLEQLVPVLEQI